MLFSVTVSAFLVNAGNQFCWYLNFPCLVYRYIFLSCTSRLLSYFIFSTQELVFVISDETKDISALLSLCILVTSLVFYCISQSKFQWIWIQISKASIPLRIPDIQVQTSVVMLRIFLYFVNAAPYHLYCL